jgi:hypothetical protein
VNSFQNGEFHHSLYHTGEMSMYRYASQGEEHHYSIQDQGHQCHHYFVHHYAFFSILLCEQVGVAVQPFKEQDHTWICIHQRKGDSGRYILIHSQYFLIIIVTSICYCMHHYSRRQA